MYQDEQPTGLTNAGTPGATTPGVSPRPLSRRIQKALRQQEERTEANRLAGILDEYREWDHQAPADLKQWG